MKRAASLLTGLLLLVFQVLPAYSAGLSCYVNDEDKRIFACGKDVGRKIALTFDDGPHPRFTKQILQVLAQYGVRATFFVIGENAALYPDVLREEIAAGHSIGSHTYSHRRVAEMSEYELRAEMEKTRELLLRFGVRASLFRPPEGVCDDKVERLSRAFDCDIILWSIDTGDWRLPGKETIVSAVLDNVRGGEIVLMHDYVSGRSNTVQALARMIPELLRRGYEFVTVDELIGQ